MNKDTPRTNSAAYNGHADLLRCSRELERENARLLAAGQKMRTWLRDNANTSCVNDWDFLPRHASSTEVNT